MRLKVIACEVFYRELCATAARSPNQVDLEFLPKGLHDIGCERMVARLQELVDMARPDTYDAVVMGYGLCSNGVVGLTARALPVVVPRAHDCITLFLGSRERYLECFKRLPGAYYKTTGWIERGDVSEDLRQLSIAHRSGMEMTYEELVAKYGEDNARYLYEELCNYTRNYDTFAFIEMGIEPDDRFERHVREDAETRGWKYVKLEGDLSLIQRLVDGEWNESECLIVPPGHRVAPSFGDGIITCAPSTPAARGDGQQGGAPAET